MIDRLNPTEVGSSLTDRSGNLCGCSVGGRERPDRRSIFDSEEVRVEQGFVTLKVTVQTSSEEFDPGSD